MFESPCSLLNYPDPRLRLCANKRLTRDTLVCVNRLTIAVLALTGCGINSVQVGQSVGAIVLNGYCLVKRARVLPLALAHVTALSSDYTTAHEGCLSVSKASKRMLRRKLIAVIYINIVSARVRAFKTDGLLATCCQHELDHSNGSLITDAIGVEQKS